MLRSKRVLVCIKRPERDSRMLDYAGAVVRLSESEEIHLLHIDAGQGKDAETKRPAEGDSQPPAPSPVTRNALQTMAAEHLEGHGKEDVICEVVSGSPLLEILRYALDKDIDVIIISRSPIVEGPEHEAVLARRVTRKATCSVLVLPVGAPAAVKRILVPVRDSQCSANAVRMACAVAAETEAAVTCLNVFQVHAGYSRAGTTIDEHIMILANWAGRECDSLLARVDTGSIAISTRCEPDLHDNAVPLILEAVADERADLIVIGARGRSGAAGVLLGKVTEKLIQQSPVPLLAVKKKGECIGLLRALLEISG